MADATLARLDRLEWLLKLTIDRLTDQPGPRDQVYMVLTAGLSEAEATSVTDIIAALQERVGTAKPPTRDEILTSLGSIRPTGIGAGPEHFVGQLLAAFEATKLLPIWNQPSGAVAAPAKLGGEAAELNAAPGAAT